MENRESSMIIMDQAAMLANLSLDLRKEGMSDIADMLKDPAYILFKRGLDELSKEIERKTQNKVMENTAFKRTFERLEPRLFPLYGKKIPWLKLTKILLSLPRNIYVESEDGLLLVSAYPELYRGKMIVVDSIYKKIGFMWSITESYIDCVVVKIRVNLP